LRRFSAAKREAIVICFLHAARAEMTDGIVEMQDKLITSIHNKARKRHEDLLRATEEARSSAVEVLEEMGTVVLNDSIPDHEVRQYIQFCPRFKGHTLVAVHDLSDMNSSAPA
jgi:hypothetical protein